MSHTTKEMFISAILSTMTEAVQKQESLYRRGFITDAERVEEINNIINKAQELILRT